jgi:hypothetical protein
MVGTEHPWSSCPWDTDADKAMDCKMSRYAGLKEELSNQGWGCGLYMIEVGARGHIQLFPDPTNFLKFHSQRVLQHQSEERVI